MSTIFTHGGRLENSVPARVDGRNWVGSISTGVRSGGRHYVQYLHFMDTENTFPIPKSCCASEQSTPKLSFPPPLKRNLQFKYTTTSPTSSRDLDPAVWLTPP
jgi:hypothetical protein